MAVDGWALVATLDITLKPGEEEVAEWKNVATLEITLAPGEEEVAEWKNVATLEITLALGTGEVADWKLVDTKIITLTIPTIACSIDADCPEGYLCVDGECVREGGGSAVPWIIAGVASLSAVGALIVRPKPKEKGVRPKEKGR